MQEFGNFNINFMVVLLPQKTIDMIFDNERLAELVRKDTEGTLTPEERDELTNYRHQARANFELELEERKSTKEGLTPKEIAELEYIKPLNKAALDQTRTKVLQLLANKSHLDK